jgi:transposase-like protein
MDYLRKLRWPNGFACPKCQAQEIWKTRRELFHCAKCGAQTSVTSGTILHGTRKPLPMWFRAMWHITNQKYGANALGLERLLGLGSYHTAWQWLHKLRRAMVRPNRDRLSGIVEVDETYVGGTKPGKRGRGAAGKALVGIAVEIIEGKDDEVMGRLRLQHLEDTSGDSLILLSKASSNRKALFALMIGRDTLLCPAVGFLILWLAQPSSNPFI